MGFESFRGGFEVRVGELEDLLMVRLSAVSQEKSVRGRTLTLSRGLASRRTSLTETMGLREEMVPD